ncbi:MAG: DMT family transporter [Solirubrobacterales bacterium]|nr:DMT family transporter [Solirubrobacterales bacterium]
MSAIALSLAAALAWGVTDFGAGLKGREFPVLVVLGGMLAVGALGGLLALLILQSPGLESQTAWLGLASGAATATGLTALYKGLAIGPMSVVAPISAGGVIVPVLVGIARGEDPTTGQIIGIVMAIVGMLVVVTLASDNEEGEGGSRSVAVACGVLGALGLGVVFVSAEDVGPNQSPWFLLVAQLTAGLALAAVVISRGLPLPRGNDVLQIAGLGVLSFAAWALSTAAVQAGKLSLTATVSSLYPIVTVLLAVAVTSETLRAGQVVALVATFLGVALIAAA